MIKKIVKINEKKNKKKVKIMAIIKFKSRTHRNFFFFWLVNDKDKYV